MTRILIKLELMRWPGFQRASRYSNGKIPSVSLRTCRQRSRHRRRVTSRHDERLFALLHFELHPSSYASRTISARGGARTVLLQPDLRRLYVRQLRLSGFTSGIFPESQIAGSVNSKR